MERNVNLRKVIKICNGNEYYDMIGESVGYEQYCIFGRGYGYEQLYY